MSTHLAQTETILGDLIAYPTVSSDSNLAMIDHLAGRLEDAGAQTDVYHSPCGTKANLFATLGPDRDGGIVLSGHSDVVPVEDQSWTSDPFQMRRDGDLLYGRGTCDMKGFIAACVAMAPDFAARDLKRPIHFAFTHDEEVGCLGARALVPQLEARGIRPAMALIGEPTMMRIIEGHKGCCEYRTQFQGAEGHGSTPDLGVNAAEYAVRYVNRLLELGEMLKTRAPQGSRFDPPWSTINIGRIAGGVATNVIAPRAEVEWEMRPVTQADQIFVKAEIDAYVADLGARMRAIDPAAGITTEIIGEVCGLEPMAQNLARDLLAALTGANGADVVPFGTEAGLFQTLGCDVVVCGPGSIDQAHKADEFISLSQLASCLSLLSGIGDRMV